MKKIKKIYLYLLLLIIIYMEFSYHMVVVNLLPGVVRMSILLITTIPLVFLYRKCETKLVLFLVYSFTLIIINLPRGKVSDYILLVIPLFIGFIIASKVQINCFIQIYNNIIYYLSFFSIIVYTVNVKLPFIIQKLPYLGNVYTYEAEIHNAFFAVGITKSVYIRNYGFAWEPGAFSLLICLALFLELSNFEGINLKRVIIYIVTIITTFSTSGYVFVFGFLCVVLNKKIKISRKRKIALVLAFGFILMFFIFMPSSIKELVFSKLRGLNFENTDKLSYTTTSRLNAVYYPFIFFISSPILGVGYEKFSIMNRLLCDGMATNTIINWFTIFGISFGLPCLLGLYKFLMKCCKRGHISKIGFFIAFFIFILIFSTESLLRISLIYILIFYGFSKQLNVK